MHIFTTNDYRKILAWLKANAVKDSDLEISDSVVPNTDTLVIVHNDNGVFKNIRIRISTLLDSIFKQAVVDSVLANAVVVNDSLTVEATKIILDKETGQTLNDVLVSLGYFIDAPSDGKIYGRRNGLWTENEKGMTSDELLLFNTFKTLTSLAIVNINNQIGDIASLLRELNS